MSFERLIHVTASLVLAISILGDALLAQSKSENELDQVLRLMESVGKRFQSFEAKLTQKKYTAVLQEFDTPETGEFMYARAKDGSALLRQEIVKPAARILTIRGGIATVYQPRIKQAQVVSLGKNKDKAEYLALGLGQSPAKLRQTFDIAYQSTEKVDNVLCAVLALKPKSAGAAAYFSSITLWISKADGLPIQQKLQEPNGDYLLVSFSGAKLNRKIPESVFEQKLPKDVEIQKIQ
jgi:outer membrane lipoprotein-sorting protein